MRYTKAITACAGATLLLAACNVPPAQVSLSPAAVRHVAQACEDLAQVDLARIPRTQPEWSAFDGLHNDTRAGLAFPQMSGAGTVLKLAIPHGGAGARHGLSVWAARQPDGRWSVSHVRHVGMPRPPLAPGSANVLAPEPPRTLTTGILTTEASALVDAALASDCLDREPFLSPATLPMRGGNDIYCPPDGGGANALEIVEHGTSRRYLRECGRTWASGTIIVALENVQNIVWE